MMRSAGEWGDRFGQWADEKTRRALAASLPPYVTDLERPGAAARGIGNAWTIQKFDGLFYISTPSDPARPACSLVFVQSSDGNTGADDPGTLGGGETDKHLIYEGLSRVAADAVLAGAKTVRGSNLIFSVWHPEIVALRASLGLPRHPVQIVSTIRGMDLDQELIFNVPEVRAIVLTTESALPAMRGALAARPWVTPLVLDADGDLRGAFARLGAIGIARISCAGGRTLAAALLEWNLVDEVYLTTSPKPGGDPATPLYASPWRGATLVRKRGTGAEAGVLFEQIVPSPLTAP